MFANPASRTCVKPHPENSFMMTLTVETGSQMYMGHDWYHAEEIGISLKCYKPVTTQICKGNVSRVTSSKDYVIFYAGHLFLKGFEVSIFLSEFLYSRLIENSIIDFSMIIWNSWTNMKFGKFLEFLSIPRISCPSC
jgi:hypothetical protein